MCQRIQSGSNIWLLKFFRQRLLTLTTDADVIAFLERFDKEVKALKDEVLRMCWYMRGGITYDQVLQLSWNERQMINDIVKENLETTKKSGLPFF